MSLALLRSGSLFRVGFPDSVFLTKSRFVSSCCGHLVSVSARSRVSLRSDRARCVHHSVDASVRITGLMSWNDVLVVSKRVLRCPSQCFSLTGPVIVVVLCEKDSHRKTSLLRFRKTSLLRFLVSRQFKFILLLEQGCFVLV